MKAMDCADYIVDKAISGQQTITNLQLQKILYLFASEYQKECGKYPFNESFQAWAYGPVIPEVYFEYKKYGSTPIAEYSKHQTVDEETFKIVSHEYTEENIDENFRKLVEEFLEKLLNINIFKIVEFTHNQKFWKSNEKKIYQHFSLNYKPEDVNFEKMGLKQLIENEFDLGVCND